jgi:hypothetical protein
MAIQIQGGEIAPAVLIGKTGAWISTKTTTLLMGVSAHPKVRIKRAWAVLVEIPDAGASTFTIALYNGGVLMSDVLSFAQGTDIVGKTKAFTFLPDMDVIAENSALTAITAGTTTTAGELLIDVVFENVS